MLTQELQGSICGRASDRAAYLRWLPTSASFPLVLHARPTGYTECSNWSSAGSATRQSRQAIDALWPAVLQLATPDLARERACRRSRLRRPQTDEKQKRQDASRGRSLSARWDSERRQTSPWRREPSPARTVRSLGLPPKQEASKRLPRGVEGAEFVEKRQSHHAARRRRSRASPACEDRSFRLRAVVAAHRSRTESRRLTCA